MYYGRLLSLETTRCFFGSDVAPWADDDTQVVVVVLRESSELEDCLQAHVLMKKGDSLRWKFFLRGSHFLPNEVFLVHVGNIVGNILDRDWGDANLSSCCVWYPQEELSSSVQRLSSHEQKGVLQAYVCRFSFDGQFLSGKVKM